MPHTTAEKYNSKMDLDAALQLALDGIEKVSGDDASTNSKERAQTLEIGMISADDLIFKVLANGEVEAILEARKAA